MVLRRRTKGDHGFVVEDSSEGRSLVVTGPWSADAADVLRRGEVDGLVLNYARGFCESSLELLVSSWGVRRLDVLDRGIGDLAPIARLGDSLEELSVQAAPDAELDLAELSCLRSIAGEWSLLRGTLSSVQRLRSVITWRFDEADLHALRDHFELQRLTIKDAPHLESLAGVDGLCELEVLDVVGARRLHDIDQLAGLASSLRELTFEACSALGSFDEVGALVNLRFLGISDCGDIASLAPVATLRQLETLYAWGSTRVLDADLSFVADLPGLRELRMRDRPGYKPRVADVIATLPT